MMTLPVWVTYLPSVSGLEPVKKYDPLSRLSDSIEIEYNWRAKLRVLYPCHGESA